VPADFSASDSELAGVLSDYHVLLAWILLIFVGMHAAAALWHHFVRRDAVLAAMLPSLSLVRRKGTDVDQPRNLAKNVTVE
jgi:cytochrome b561